jgi:ribosomal protein S18 acetylase RimI-like enzyme
MTNDGYRIEPLGSHHDRAAFASGVEPLDRYLREQAGQEVRRGAAAVHVLVDSATGAIVGYYTLSAAVVVLSDLPAEMARKAPRYPSLPALLIGQLAVDQRYRGQRFGERLLVDALHRCMTVKDVGWMFVIVDAKDDRARAFYERYGFQRLADAEYRLFLPVGTVTQLGRR